MIHSLRDSFPLRVGVLFCTEPLEFEANNEHTKFKLYINCTCVFALFLCVLQFPNWNKFYPMLLTSKRQTGFSIVCVSLFVSLALSMCENRFSNGRQNEQSVAILRKAEDK